MTLHIPMLSPVPSAGGASPLSNARAILAMRQRIHAACPTAESQQALAIAADAVGRIERRVGRLAR